MPRTKTGTTRRARHKKILKRAKGFSGRRKNVRNATQTLLNAADYSYRDRRDKKNVIRRLWITRINAATRLEGVSYSSFMHGLRAAGVDIDRKVLADLAVREPESFRKLVDVSREAVQSVSA